MDTHYHPSIAHYFLLFLLTSSYMQSTTKLCFCLAGGALSSSVKTNPCIDEERQALLIFKRHLVDASGRLSSWVGHDCCQWKGVSCNNRTGHVVKMDLRNPYEEWDMYEKFSLGGKRNASLLSLKHLNYLDLSYNDFHSNQIPKFFGDLKTLQYPNLSSTSFGREIPPSLGNLSSLSFLDLNSNYDLTSRNLNWLSRLSSLKYLNLGNVNLSTIGVNWVYAVNMLPSLAELHLSSCQIESISLSLQSINSASLFNLTSLIALDLSFNDFGDPFPSEFANFKSLEYLDLSYTSLKSQIPKVIGNLCKLKVLSLSHNEFNGGIEEFWRSFYNCPNIALESLDLAYCELGSQLPVSLGMFKSLQNLNLHHNNLRGSIPDSIGNLSSLETLDLSSNIINGSIPDSIGNLSSLKTLDLSSNFLNGSIPDSIGNLSSLKTLDLYSNFMNGFIPQSLGQLSQLVSHHLSSNFWEGILTKAHFINLTQLQDFSVGDKNQPISLIFHMAYDWIPPFKLHTINIINCRYKKNGHLLPTFSEDL
nr:receptor-like protein EIX1 [Malus domestica]